MSDFEFIAWFAGFGGSSSGFEQAGGRGIGAFDLNQMSLDTHATNMPGMPTFRCNMRSWKSDDFASAMRLAGIAQPKTWKGVHSYTPPCQGFCQSNLGSDPLDLNSLTPMVVELAKASPKSLIVMEQVPSMLSIDSESSRPVYEKQISELLEGLRRVRGIDFPQNDLKKFVVNAACFKVPQKRKRLILPFPPDGYRMLAPLAPDLPDKVDWMTVRQAIGVGWIDPYPQFKPLTITERMIYQNVKDGQTLSRNHPLIPIIFPRRLLEGKCVGNKFYRTAWDEPSRTIIRLIKETICDRVSLVHPAELRYLSVGECARLMGFPSHWLFAGNIWDQYRQISAAVCPAVTLAVAKQWLLTTYHEDRA